VTSAVWRAVLFDLDGTLADTVELILESFRHTMRTHLGTVPPDAAVLRGIGTPLPVQIGGFAESDAQRAEMLATYVAYQQEHHDSLVRPFPGADAVVSELRRRGSAVGVVTSKARGIALRTMEVCGIHEHFDFVVCGDEVERGKPDPEPVIRAMRALGVHEEPQRVIFVGDSTHDLRAGRSAGVRTAAVAWGPIERRVLEAEAPDYFLGRMEELLEVRPD
jgi:pyrophosphatase PpaX